MASIVMPSGLPRYGPMISFDMEENRAFLRSYLEPASSPVTGERYDAEEVPKRAFLESDHETLPDFVAIHGRLDLSPETRALVEEFEPGVHQFFPVEIVRARGKWPIHRLDGRVLDSRITCSSCRSG